MSKPKTIAERNNQLEMEVNTTKDTIWRLTNRVCVLETEFKRFKDLLKRSVLKPSSDELITPTKRVSSEMPAPAKRQNRESNVIVEETVVKTEIVDSCAESSDGDTPMDDCMSDVGSSGDFHKSPAINNDKNDEEFCPWSDSDDSEEDHEPRIRIKPPRELFGTRAAGRKKHEIWDNFKRMQVIAEDGKKTSITICKKCKRTVGSGSGRMQNHLEKCTMVPTDPLEMDEHSTLENVETAGTVANINNVENFGTGDNNVDYAAIAAEAISLNPSGLGRKRAPIWRHFIRKPKPETPDRPNRKYSFIAICNNCKAEVSAQPRRMTLHLKKCLAGKLNTKSIGKLKSEAANTKDCVTLTKILLDVPQSSGQIKASNEMKKPTKKFKPANRASGIIDSAKPNNTTPKSSLDNAEFTNEVSFLNSSIPTPGPGKRTSTVWQHYNITEEVRYGKMCITAAACKYCAKVVSPKADRMALHLKKCTAFKPQ